MMIAFELGLIVVRRLGRAALVRLFVRVLGAR